MQVGIYLIVFIAHMSISFIIKVKFLVLIKLWYTPPEIMLTIEPRMVGTFWVHSPISYEHISFLMSVLRSTSNHTSRKYRCPNYFYVGFWHVYLREVGGSEITEAIAVTIFDNRWMALCHVSKPGMSFDGLCIKQRSEILWHWLAFK